MNMQHTPTPYAVGKAAFSREGRAIEGDVFTIVMPGACSAVVYSMGEEKARVEATAAFIVRACNGWNDIEALRARIAELEGAE